MNKTISVRITMRWWVRPYVSAIAWFAAMTGAVPDHDKLGRLIVRHGFKVRVVP